MKKNLILSIILFILLIILGFLRFDLLYKIKSLNPITNYKRITYKPTVTVLIPSYNMGSTLPAAIDSIINQTYKDWELLVINDGSLDKTREILKPYNSNYKIRIIHNRENLGLIRTLNKGLKLSRGKYIVRLDADDYSLPNRLERQIPLIEKENIDFLSQTHYYTDKIKNEKPDDLDTYSNGVHFLYRAYFSHSSCVFRKSFLTENNIEYDSNYPNAEDYALYLAIFFKGGKIGAIGGQPVTVYQPANHSLLWWQTVKVSYEKIRVHYLSKIIPNFDRFEILPLSFCEMLPKVIEGNKTTKVLDQKQLEKQYKLKCTGKAKK